MKNIRVFYQNIFQFLKVKFTIYLNRRVFLMKWTDAFLYSIQKQHSCFFFFVFFFLLPGMGTYGKPEENGQ